MITGWLSQFEKFRPLTQLFNNSTSWESGRPTTGWPIAWTVLKGNEERWTHFWSSEELQSSYWMLSPDFWCRLWPPPRILYSSSMDFSICHGLFRHRPIGLQIGTYKDTAGAPDLEFNPSVPNVQPPSARFPIQL